MRISHKHKFIFISVPKTGSATIRKFLDEFSDIRSVDSFQQKTEQELFKNHISAIDLKKCFKKNGRNWDDYFSFGFVRNPWDKLVSNFFYQKKYIRGYEKYSDLTEPTKGGGRPTRVVNKKFYEACKKNTQNKTFKEYLLGLSYWPRPCSGLLFNENGKQLVNFVGRFENLQEDFRKACNKIDIPCGELIRFNSTEHEYYAEYYDNEAKEIVMKKYAKDIGLFGYKFENKS